MSGGFPDFIKNPADQISAESQYTEDIMGYVFDCDRERQVAFWECFSDKKSEAHRHDYDEYLVITEGRYTLIIDGRRIELSRGDEYTIPKGTEHSGECIAGTRTIHVFNGRRVNKAVLK
jgi:mannose-6-phosphate isomerase-like protein (cupin superfamily)